MLRIHTIVHPSFLRGKKVLQLAKNFLYWFYFNMYCLLEYSNSYSCNRITKTEFKFLAKGEKFLHCPRTKGQWDNLKILPWDGMGRDSLSKSGTGQSLFFCQNTGWGRDRISFFTTSFPVLQHLFLFCNILFLFCNILFLF